MTYHDRPTFLVHSMSGDRSILIYGLILSGDMVRWLVARTRVPLAYNWRYLSASANVSKITMHTNNHAIVFLPVFGTARLRNKWFPRISKIIK